MMKRKAILRFDSSTVEEPVTYQLIKKYDLWINILQAKFEPGVGGKLVLEMRGDKKSITAGLLFLKKQQVKIEFLEQEVFWNQDRCNHCGACVSVCPVNALSLNSQSYHLEFNYQDCVVCGYCAEACPVQAIDIIF